MVKTTTALLAVLAVSRLFADGTEVAEPRAGTPTVQFVHEARLVTNGAGFLAQTPYSVPGFLQAIDREGRSITSPRAGWWDRIVGWGDGYLTVDRGIVVRLDATGARVGTIASELPPGMPHPSAGGANDLTILLIDSRPTLALVDHQGRLIASHPIGTWSKNVLHIEATTSGYDVFVTEYVAERSFQLYRLSNDGALSAPITLSTDSVSAATAAYVGSELMVAWAAGRVLQAAIVSPDGTITRGMDRTLWIEPLLLVPNATGALVIGTRTGPMVPADRTGWAIQLDKSAREAGQAQPVAEGRRMLDVASNGTIIYVLTAGPAPIGEYLIGLAQSVSLPSAVVREEIFGRGRATQHSPAVAANASQALIVWQETSAEEIALRGRFVIGGQPFGEPIAIHSSVEGISAPLVAAADGMFLVAWMETDGLRVKRVAANGIVLDASPLVIANPFSSLVPIYISSVASNGRDFAIVWQDSGGFRGRVVTQHGALGPEQLLTTLPQGTVDQWEHQVLPSLVWDGSRFVLVFSHYLVRWSYPGSYVRRAEVRGRFFDSELRPQGEETLILSDAMKAVAAQGRDSLLVLAGRPQRLSAMIVDRSLRPVSESKLSFGGWYGYPEYSPHGVVASWNGQHYIAVMRGETSINLAKIDLTGAVTFAFRSVFASNPVIASSGNGTLIVVSERRADGPAPPIERIVLYGPEDFSAATVRRRSARH